ncbi:FAD-binding oxidoreductase [Kitasatospora sp. NPDC002543]
MTSGQSGLRANDASTPNTAAAEADWSALRPLLRGDVVLPSDPEYDLAKQLHVAEFDSARPRAVAYCETPEDVSACVRFAAEHGVPVHPRSGGHSLAGWSTGAGLVVDLSRIAHAEPLGGTVRFGPGLLSVDALAALKESGEQIVTGTFPTVAAAGYLLGGGIGHQTRKFGLASDRLVAATVVLADGRIVRASETEEPELFWALRGGGGGNFGIVVDFEVRSIPVSSAVHFTTIWSWDDTHRVLAAWQEWIAGAAREIGSSVLVVMPDAGPDAVPIVQVSGVCWGSLDQLEAALDEFVAATGAVPEVRDAAELPYDEVMFRVYGLGELTAEELHRVGGSEAAKVERIGFQRERHQYLARPLDGPALDRVLADFSADRHAEHTRYLWIIALGGAADDLGPAETAYPHRGAPFIAGYCTLVPDAVPQPEAERAMTAWVDRGFEALAPQATGGAYVNFPDPALRDWQRAYYGDNYPRLLDAKAKYDPEDVFHHGRSVGG